MKVMRPNWFSVLVATLVVTGSTLVGRAESGVEIKELPDRLRVEINGKLFTEYRYKDVPKPFCYPVISASGKAMTRKWPVEETDPTEEKDHVHHQGIWFGHHKVNGTSFWTIGGNTGTQVQERLVTAKSGKDVGTITTENKWVTKDGKVVIRDERTLRFYNRENDRIIDYDVTFKATEGDVLFGDDKDSLMAIRVAESMRTFKVTPKGEKAKAGDGHIVLSTGVRDDGKSAAAAKDAKQESVTWGKKAEWCDYYGPVDGKTVGVAIFDHPSNPRHPTWWHVRDYGLFSANPFGKRYFERLSDENAGNLTLKKGETLTFKYRLYFQDVDEKEGKVAERYAEYAKTK